MADMMDMFVGVMLAAVIGAGIAIPVANQVFVTDTNSVTNETINSSGSISEILAVDEAPDGYVEDSTTVFLKNETGGQTFLLAQGDNYTELPEQGEVNVTTLSTDVENSLDSNDQYNVSYDGKPEGFIENGSTRLVVGFVVLGIAISVFLASLAPIRGRKRRR